MKLHSFFRSGTSHRLRIALNLKGLSHRYRAVDLRTEQRLCEAYKALHPQGLVPSLQSDGKLLIQSPAIIEWLEERHPAPPLLPADPDRRAHAGTGGCSESRRPASPTQAEHPAACPNPFRRNP